MLNKGIYKIKEDTYNAAIEADRNKILVILYDNQSITSAYKKDASGSYIYSSDKAKKLSQVIADGIKKCTAKNSVPMAFELGAMNNHEFAFKKRQYIIREYSSNKDLVGAFIYGDDFSLEVMLDKGLQCPTNIPFIKETNMKIDFDAVDDLDSIPVKSVEEIAMTKDDVTWLQGKQYYIVNDDATAEQIFSVLDNYNGPIGYDVETTGLKINCFSKINSSYKKNLEAYNKSVEKPEDKIRADKLVGLIFCIQPDISYYFPCANRKFANLYANRESEYRKRIITNIKAQCALTNEYFDEDMRDYLLNTPENEITEDVVLFMRIKKILETKSIVTHGGKFEYRAGLVYGIDTNIVDDTMILHQIMYKFRSTTANSGEPSNLKYLSKVELGIDQWELSDFFPSYKENESGRVKNTSGGRRGKANSLIDFSYMDYDGTRIYAPADGDCTLELYLKYKKDLLENHKEMEYIYSVEILVSMAIGYMEFYGHRIDERKINDAKEETIANLRILESELRQSISYSSERELQLYNELKDCVSALGSELDKEKLDELRKKRVSLSQELENTINNDEEHKININSPAQLADLFFNKLKYPMQGDKPSVAKNVIKALVKEKTEDGQPACPVAIIYQQYVKQNTLLTKFFGALGDFMYPGGFIFSTYGQIAAATGRMSCKEPNAQQYPKVITKIVVPRDNYVMVDADYSQIEYRVLTALAKNEGLAELFADPDSDYHTLMASLMYEVPYEAVTSQMRSAAKSFNFGIPYGMGLGSLAILLTGKNTAQTRDEAKEKYEQYFKNQPRTRLFFDNIKEMAQINKYTKTLFNRYRYYSFTDKDGNINDAKRAAALRQAGNAVIQGTAADIFKIGVARNFSYIRRNHLFGKVLIVNMIHDEQLIEVDSQRCNVQRVLSDIGKNMQFGIEGFPPLFIGAGVGKAWGYAKGKMAEIHPLLLDQLTKEAEALPIENTEVNKKTSKEVVDYFDNRVYDFRKEKVKQYLLCEENWHRKIHPAIGGLINLQFNYGRGEDAKAYTGPNGEKYSDAEFLEMNLSEFIEKNNLPVKAEWFSGNDTIEQVNEEVNADVDFDDEEDINENPGDEYMAFAEVDESNKLYGSSLKDLIEIFGACIISSPRVCGINVSDLGFRQRDDILDILMPYITEDTTNGYEVVFLTDAKVLNHTGIYVNGIKTSEFETQYKLIKNNYKNKEGDYSNAEVENRKHA